ncbi:putative kinase [Corynascus novoguineensis]|uniref:Kinase n=1 Tax=Corynascus novoguineensis TaxID=1126955 RepID=A0AAN7HFA6_9PEZI|nr:putative kinase [Corynascus novoguineensis]
MSSSKYPFEGEGKSQPSSPAAEVTPPANDAEHSDRDPDGSVRRLRRRIREKLRAQGRPAPDSPPPPPTLAYSHPLARELLDAGGEVIYEKISCWIVKHACGTRVTKFHLRGIRPAEVEAMRFVSEHTTIPVPRVYDVGEQHLTMEFIEGETLKEAWENTLSVEDRALVVRQLRDYVNQLRAIKSPDGVICSFGGRPAVDSRFFYLEGGPFADEAAYNDFLVSDLVGHSSVRDMIRSQMREDHEIVLTHGDLHAINILARPGVGVVAIIDWELAGFYPEYLDLVRPFRPADWTCGYYKELLNIFPQRYDAEWVVEMVLHQWSHH